MKILNWIFLFGLCLYVITGFSQKEKIYFQQRVNTSINVELDDVGHFLKGTAYLEYYNESPDNLDTLYFHLWANAYQDKNTAFSQQKLKQGDASFYFADESQLGAYDSIQFFIDGRNAPWQFHPRHKDIALIPLDKPLKAGKDLAITIPFKIKIPGSFSRFGHEGQSYQITQWYPKPAVYDRDGWHPMPYLDMGEFYSEFGDFDVTITLPENYFVAATGELLTNSEHKRIQKRIQESKENEGTVFDIPPSSQKKKSIRFIAENVHDFAWFADKRYLIKEKMIDLPKNNKVLGQVFYLPQHLNSWKNSLQFLERGLRFYSENVGDYPYPKVAVVDGPLKAGSGMEYPMITVISAVGTEESLDQVIIHEIGHNWFYGILAFNERRYPWLDEGINSYYDHRYSRQYYSKNQWDDMPGWLKSLLQNDWYSTFHAFATNKAMTQPSDLPSTDFSLYNYFLGAYQNPAMAFRYLETYLGQQNFDALMQSFFKKWAFRHPGPEDLQAHFEAGFGKELDWFFESMIGDVRTFDYGIKKLAKKPKGFEVTLQNHSGVPIPLQFSAYKDDQEIYSGWIEGFDKERLIHIPSTDMDKFIIDPNRLYSDLNLDNNYSYYKKHLFPRKTSTRFLNLLDDQEKKYNGWLPSLGWNKGDGFMLGAMLYSHKLPQNNFNFILHPLFAFGQINERDALTGMGKLSYDWYLGGMLRNIHLASGIKSFHYRFPNDKSFRYTAFNNELRFRINRSLVDKRYADLTLRAHFIENEKSIYQELNLDDPKARVFSINIQQYDHRVLLPVKWKGKLEYGDFDDHLLGENDRYLKIEAELTSHFMYRLNKSIAIRLYGGRFLWQNHPKSTITRGGTLGLVGYAMNDYLYQDYFFDRGGQEGFWSQQINRSGGGFKTAVNTAHNLGQSNKYVAAVNLKADLPFDVPVLSLIKPFVDLGVYGYLPTLSEEYQNRFLYSSGLMIEGYEGIFNLYLPLFNSTEIENIYKEEANFFKRFSFSLNLNIFDFTQLLYRDDILFGQ
jgi:hypothetical protein